MAWPTYPRTTEKPAPSATVCTAKPTSWRRLPSTSWPIPAYRLSSVTRRSFSTFGGTSPTATVTAASPWYPSMIAPQSSEMMSPSLMTYGPGMPWTMTLLGDVQMTAGKPWYPRKLDRLPVARAPPGPACPVVPSWCRLDTGRGDLQHLGHDPAGLAHLGYLVRPAPHRPRLRQTGPCPRPCLAGGPLRRPPPAPLTLSTSPTASTAASKPRSRYQSMRGAVAVS